MEKLRMMSPDLTDANIEKLADLFPMVMTESVDTNGNVKKAIDFDLLRQELSDHIVDGPQERYRLDWPGKRAAAFAANAPIAKTLRPVREESVDFDSTKNLFIEGDNLDALKLLQESYLGQVQLIYIDPPYNTGNDFVYADKYAKAASEELVLSGQVTRDGVGLVANPISNGRFHSDWLSMMLPRLRLARTLLSSEGLIVCSIDSHEVQNLAVLMDEIFGVQNRIAIVPVVMNLKGNPDAFAFADSHEYLLVWARDRENCKVGAFPVDSAELDDWEQDDYGPFKRADTLRRSGADASRSRRPNGWFPVFITSDRTVYVTQDDVPIDSSDVTLWPMNDAGDQLSWTWSKAKIQSDPHNLVVIDGRSGLNIYKKQRPQLGDQATSKPKSVLYSPDYSSSSSTTYLKNLMGAKVFDNPKSMPLMRDLLRIGAPGRDDLVLDFFAGSGSMADAVMRQNASDGGNRPYILVQIPEAVPEDSPARHAGFRTIAELARARCKAAAANILAGHYEDEWRKDIGFRLLKVDATNRADVIRTPDDTRQETLISLVDSIKVGRSAEDLLFQVLIEWGLELTMPIAVEQIDGQDVFVVEEGAVIACFGAEINPSLVRSIANREPLRVVFLDSGFDSDDARINTEQIFREVSPATVVKAL